MRGHLGGAPAELGALLSRCINPCTDPSCAIARTAALVAVEAASKAAKALREKKKIQKKLDGETKKLVEGIAHPSLPVIPDSSDSDDEE